MRFVALAIDGAFEIHPEPHHDARGFFARTVAAEEMAANGLLSQFGQSSISYNVRSGTVRGMHYSIGPNAETKLVRCTAGAVLDALVDVRPGSATFGQRVMRRLDASNRVALYIPRGIAHGFQTLADDTEVIYMIDAAYEPTAARGFRYNDSIAAIKWPLPVSTISVRDAEYADFVAGQ